MERLPPSRSLVRARVRVLAPALVPVPVLVPVPALVLALASWQGIGQGHVLQRFSVLRP